MKHLFLLVLLLTLVLGIGACNQGGSTDLPTKMPAVEDQASLIAAFRGTGAKTEVVDTIDQIFFSPQGNIFSINGADIQVFEYESSESMEAEASQVASDGSSIGTSMITWIDTPHFYKTGRIIVLYVGSDLEILNLLEKVLGTQFAGR